MAEARVPVARLRATCRGLLEAAGVPRADAEVAAAGIVEADLRGVPSHGVGLLPGYLARLRAGGLNPRPRLVVVSEAAAVAVLDGDGGLGHVVATRAMEVAIERARSAGMGACAAGHSSHFGIAATYAEVASAAGMIGIAISNSVAVMPPPGGAAPRVGVTAFAYALPGEVGQLGADLAMSVGSRGKILLRAGAGEPIPGDWALDAEGRPTTDAAAAAAGLLLPLGGHKGFALALLWDALAGMLSGSRYGAGAVREPADRPGDIGHFMVAIDVARFVPPERFRAAVDEVARSIRETPRLAGSTEEPRVPGERSRAERERSLREGVALPDRLVADLDRLAAEVGAARLSA